MAKLSEKGKGTLIGLAIGVGIVVVAAVIFFIYSLNTQNHVESKPAFALNDAEIGITEPSQNEFSGEETWMNYELNWQDPAWDGEYPAGSRVKTAQYVNVKDKTWLSYYQNEQHNWVAGILLVHCSINEPATNTKAQMLADDLGAYSFRIIGGNSDINIEPYDIVLLFLDESTNLPYLISYDETLHPETLQSSGYDSAEYITSDTFMSYVETFKTNASLVQKILD